MSNKKIRIAIDCMGGDIGLSVTVPAALLFAKRYPDVHCLLVGEPQAIEQTLRAQGNVDTSWYDILPASEVVTMADSVEVALRRKKRLLHASGCPVRQGWDS